MSDPYWTFPQFPENNTWEIRYLCWRACGETREHSTRLANEGYMPASWWMLYRDDGRQIMENEMKEEKTVPLKEIVPFEIWQTIFEKMMEREEQRWEGEEQ